MIVSPRAWNIIQSSFTCGSDRTYLWLSASLTKSKDRYDPLPKLNISAITKWLICNNFNRGYHIAHLIVVHCCVAVSLNIPRHYCDSYVGFTGVECKNANLWELFPYECLEKFWINRDQQAIRGECNWMSYHMIILRSCKFVLPQITKLHTNTREDNVQLLGITPYDLLMQ